MWLPHTAHASPLHSDKEREGSSHSPQHCNHRMRCVPHAAPWSLHAERKVMCVFLSALDSSRLPSCAQPVQLRSPVIETALQSAFLHGLTG